MLAVAVGVGDLAVHDHRVDRAELQELGLCYRFYYRWQGGDEHRCIAPPGGKIEKIITIEDHVANDPRLMVRVDVYDKTDKRRRNPPLYGSGCEPLVPS